MALSYQSVSITKYRVTWAPSFEDGAESKPQSAHLCIWCESQRLTGLLASALSAELWIAPCSEQLCSLEEQPLPVDRPPMNLHGSTSGSSQTLLPTPHPVHRILAPSPLSPHESHLPLLLSSSQAKAKAKSELQPNGRGVPFLLLPA